MQTGGPETEVCIGSDNDVGCAVYNYDTMSHEVPRQKVQKTAENSKAKSDGGMIITSLDEVESILCGRFSIIITRQWYY
jgi:hypothetical protein